MARGSNRPGFTLIELLVVIAIIGMLASVILAAVSSVLGKGADAAIKSQLRDVETQAQLDYNSHNPPCYDGNTAGTCIGVPGVRFDLSVGCTISLLCNDTVIYNALSAALAASANTTGGFIAMCQGSGGISYGFAVQLRSNSGLAWCIDSVGDSKQEGTVGTPLTSATIYSSTMTTSCTCQ